MFSKVTKCVKWFTNIITLGILTVPVMREIHEPYVVLLSYATFSIMSSLPNQSVQPLRRLYYIVMFSTLHRNREGKYDLTTNFSLETREAKKQWIAYSNFWGKILSTKNYISKQKLMKKEGEIKMYPDKQRAIEHSLEIY